MAPTHHLFLVALLASASPSSAAGLNQGPEHTLHPRDGPADSTPSAIAPGTACPGCEGEWNCLGRAWQRCASGRWSDVRPLACGTACSPIGRSYDFSLGPDPDATASVCSAASTTAMPATTTAAGTNASCTSSSPSSSSPSSSSIPSGFTSGSAASPLGPASGAQNGRTRLAAAVVSIGTAAVVFARLLM